MTNNKVKQRTEKIVDNGQKIKALKSKFRGKLGKDALSLIEEIGYYHKSTYVHGDPHGTSVNEGLRQMVLKIHEFINMSDEEIDRRIEDKLKAIKK
jgi:hypothetical protein